MFKLSLLLMAIFCYSLAAASIEHYDFATPEQEQTYTHLLQELRCLVCQNQNLADSNAQLAQDLRAQVHHLVVDKQMSEAQVIDYLVVRYGEFVRYRPAWSEHTFLLWTGPFLLLFLAAWGLWRFWRSQSVSEGRHDA